MPIAFDKQLEDMITTLTQWSSWLTAHGQRESAAFVNITRLELQLVLNRISDDELRALCDAAREPESNPRIIPGPCLTGAEPLGEAQNKRIMRLAMAQSSSHNRKH
jgi:hypothetical protein